MKIWGRIQLREGVKEGLIVTLKSTKASTTRFEGANISTLKAVIPALLSTVFFHF